MNPRTAFAASALIAVGLLSLTGCSAKAKTVFACGDWSVMAADDGWYGWTPNSEEERSAAAAE